MRSTASFSFINILTLTFFASQASSLKIEDILSPSYLPNLFAELDLVFISGSTSNPSEQYVLINNPAVPSADCLSYLSNNPLSDTDSSWEAFEAPTSPCLTLPVSSLTPSAIQALGGDGLVRGSANCQQNPRDPVYSDATAACMQLENRPKEEWCYPSAYSKCNKHHEWGTAGVYYCAINGNRGGMPCSLMGAFALWGAKLCRRGSGMGQTGVAVRMYSDDFEGFTVVQNSAAYYP